MSKEALLASLQGLAVKSVVKKAYAQKRKLVGDFSLEELREACSIKDRKRMNTSEEQHIGVTLGRFKLPLDLVGEGVTELLATGAEEVAATISTLREAVDGGLFDDVLLSAQAKAVASLEAAQVKADNTEEMNAESDTVDALMSEDSSEGTEPALGQSAASVFDNL